jgi:hypothetical protein
VRAAKTITAARLTELAGQSPTTGPSATAGPPGEPPWIFARGGDLRAPGGHDTWTLTLPDGGNLAVEFEPMPTLECDHRHESHAYQPNDKLRHLVQVRDYECTFPPCSRHARDSDFEHAVPYDRGGRTCGCNAGAQQAVPPGEAVSRLDGHPAQAGLASVADPGRPGLRPRPQAISGLTAWPSG